MEAAVLDTTEVPVASSRCCCSESGDHEMNFTRLSEHGFGIAGRPMTDGMTIRGRRLATKSAAK